jgi:hypothetical protein
MAAIARAEARVLPLAGLAPKEVACLVEQSTGLTPTDRLIEALHERTGGNPFFISQVIPCLSAGLAENGLLVLRAMPESVRDAVAQQLDGLSTQTQEIIEVAAVIGRDFSLGALEHVARALSPRSILTAISEASAAHIIVTRDTGAPIYRFAHVLLRDALYDRLTPRKRAELHRLVAEGLERLHGADIEPHLAEIAHHYFQAASAAGGEHALEICEQAGSWASERMAYEEAVEHYTNALELLDLHAPDNASRRCDLLLALGAEQTRSGDRSAAKRTFERAARVANHLGASDRLARAALGLAPGFFAVEAGVPDDLLLGLLRGALAALGDHDLRTATMLSARLAMALYWTSEDEERGRLSSSAWGWATSIGDPPLLLYVLYARWFAEWNPFNVDTRFEMAREILDLGSKLGERELSLVGRLFLLTGLLERGQIVEFDQELALFVRCAEDINQPQGVWYARMLRATRALLEGRLTHADQLSSEFFEIGRRVGDSNVYHSRMAHRLLLAWELQDLEGMVGVTEATCSRFPSILGWRAAHAWSLCKAGRSAEAARQFDYLARDGFRISPQRMDWPVAVALLSEVCWVLGDAKRAEQLYALLRPLEGRFAVLGLCVMSWGSVDRYLGQLAAAMSRSKEAAEHFEVAISKNASIGAHIWCVHSQIDYARVLMRDTREASQRRARELASDAALRAQELGLKAAASELEDLRRLL